MKIFGFSLLRNGVKYDYPFLESLSSLTGLCEKVFLALGNSEDSTATEIESIPKLVKIPTVWDENMRKSGLILSQQSNIALAALRKELQEDWAFYLQADEVLNEKEFPLIRADLQKALESGCDAVSFRYLHFWHSYEQIAVGKRWYPQEIRAIKVNSEIESYGDAQSFRTAQKIYFSDAHIFHYGHVREEVAYQKKLSDFGRWWHGDEELKKVLAKGAKNDLKEESIRYLGSHPKWMAKRIREPQNPTRKIWVFGNKNEYPELQQVNIHWTLNVHEIIRAGNQNSVLLEDFPLLYRPLQWLYFPSKVPKKMKSPQARAWTKGFWAMLKFSEKNFSLNG